MADRSSSPSLARDAVRWFGVFEKPYKTEICYFVGPMKISITINTTQYSA
jgi:hypothetical protein